MEALCAIGFALFVLMVIGHGMWVALAWVFRSLGGDAAVIDGGKPCPHCGARFGVKQGRCVVCGSVPLSVPNKSVRADELRATSRQLKRLCEQGSITQKQHDDLLAVIAAELEQLAPRPKESIPRLAPSRPATVLNSLAAPAAPQPEVIDAILVEPAVVAGNPAPAAAAPKVHPLDRPYVPPPPAPPRQPGRSLADMLQSFMEESNIRWGEILAATLIVLCSVGLVISLRNTLKDIPYFPAILFTTFTVAFHGAGLYTLRRWKLQAVSRVILMISLLLVPLTFCGAIVLQQTRPATDPMFLVALAIGVGIFTWVSYSASRELVGPGAWPLTIGVLGSSLGQVLMQRLDFAGGALVLNIAAGIPIASFLIATGWHLARARGWTQLSRGRIVLLLHVLGIAAFALLPPLVLILLNAGPPTATLARLSPQLSLAAAATLAMGLLIHRRTTAKSLVGWQTVGTAILVLAGVWLVLLVAAAWPDPELLLVLGLMNGAILVALGIIAELPLLFVPGVACAALAAVTGWHLVGGHFADRNQLSLKMVQAALRGQTGLVLTMLGAAVAGFGGWLANRKRTEEAVMVLASGGGLAVASLLIVLFSGFVTVPNWPQDRDLSAAILMVYAIALIAAGPISRRQEVAACGSLLLWLALVQSLAFNATIRGWLSETQGLLERPILVSTLLHGVITAIVSAIASRRAIWSAASEFNAEQATGRHRLLAEPLAMGAAFSLVAAAPFIVWVRGGDFSASAVMAVMAATGWVALALSQRWPWAISGLQAMLALAPALLIAGAAKARHGQDGWFFQEQHLLAQLIAAALGTIVWSIARRVTSGYEVPRRMLDPPWPAVDQMLLGVATVIIPALAFFIAAPHVGWELGFAEEDALLPATEVIGLGWFALAAILAALAVSLWERITFPAAAGFGIATFAGVWLVAAQFGSASAAASAARWAAALYAVAWVVVFIVRDPIRIGAKHVSALRWQDFPPPANHWFGGQPLIFGGTTILILTILAVQQHLHGAALHPPTAGTFFAAIGATWSYVVPLAALVAVLLAYAMRERQAGFALGGAAVSQLAVNLAYLLHVNSAQPADLRAIEWLKWNSIAAGTYALVWLALSRRITPPAAEERERRLADGLWFVPLALSGLTAAILVVWAAWAIAQSPGTQLPVLVPLGSWLSYLAVGLALAAIVWRSRGKLEIQGLGDAVAWLAAGIVPLVGASVSRFDLGGQWLAYHTLEVGWLLVSAVACGLVCWRLSRLTPHHLSVTFITGLSVALAIFGNKGDPGQPWWSVGIALSACGVASALALARRSQPYAYASTVLAALAMVLFWFAPDMWPFLVFVFETTAMGWKANLDCVLLALVAAAGLWLWLEIESQRRLDQSFDPRTMIPRVHALVAAALPFYFLYRAMLALASLALAHSLASDIVSILVVIAFGGLILAAYWDRRFTFAVPLAYVWGCVVWMLAIEIAAPWLPERLSPRWHYNMGAHLVFFVTAAALHVAATGQLWSYGANLAAQGARLGVSDPVSGLARTANWLPIVNIVLAALLCAVDCFFVLTLGEQQLPFRVIAALGPAIVAWGMLCLAQERRRDDMQLASLLLAGLSAVYLAWAQLEPGHDAALWLTRVFRLLMVLAALTFIYGLALPRFLLTSGSWNAATRKAGYIAATLALTTFVVTLVLEVALFVPDIGAPVENIQVVAIAVVLLALIAGLISLALLPGRDPLVLSEQGRQGYVYAAEITAALLFAHLYVCRPYWFNELLRPYWPFIVMGLAFIGVGAAELFERYRIRVLAEPLARTGAMLPLLPVLGMWVIPIEADRSLVLLVAGLLYLALSYTRKSWAAMLAAAVAGNGALWSLLSETRFAFLDNPQLWLIPPALSVLVAAQVNRRRLTPEMLTGIRYVATSVIYVSSTSEIFIRGFEGGVAPPMILLGLAVAGAVVGIALRVRAFLMLGSTFTLMALITMVRHAAHEIEHTGPWWVFGITLGVCGLILRGFIEKNRPQLMLLIARLQKWEQ